MRGWHQPLECPHELQGPALIPRVLGSKAEKACINQVMARGPGDGNKKGLKQPEAPEARSRPEPKRQDSKVEKIRGLLADALVRRFGSEGDRRGGSEGQVQEAQDSAAPKKGSPKLEAAQTADISRLSA